MEVLKSFIWEYRFIIMLAVALGVFCLFEWQRAKAIGYSLMLQAKSLAKDAVLKSGKAQEEWVVKKALQFMPKSLVIFISEETMRKLVHYLYTKGKDYLDDGQVNNSIQ